MWTNNSLNHSSIIVKYWITCVLIIISARWNLLKVNGSILIVENMSKKSLTHYNELCK
jgi:hypothetical protein